MNVEQELKKHIAEDKAIHIATLEYRAGVKLAFDKQDNILKQQELDHEQFRNDLRDIKGFMQELSWLADITKGTQLLKKPSLWILGLVLGIVALMGGLKAFFVALLATLGIKTE